MNLHFQKRRYGLLVELLLYVVLFFSLYTISKTVYSIFAHTESYLNDYLLSELLLHYTTHYTRRSLVGEITKWFDIQNYYIFFPTLYLLIFIVIIIFALRYFKDIQLRILCFSSPIGILFYFSDWGSFFRKEVLFFPFLITTVFLFSRQVRNNVKFIVLLASSLICYMIHDSFLFLLFPTFFFLLLYENYSVRYIFIYLIVIAFMTLGNNFFVFTGKDLLIYDNFFRSKSIDWSPTKALLLPNLFDNIKYSLNHLEKYNFVFYLAVYFFHLWMLRFVFPQNFNKKKLFFLFQTIAVLGFFFIAVDYGRWIAMAFFNSLLIISYKQSKEEKQIKFWPLLIVVSMLLLLRVPHWSDLYLWDKDFLYSLFKINSRHIFEDIVLPAFR